MKEQALVDFLEFAMRGYTVRRIRELMKDKGWDLEKVPDASLVLLIREYAPALETRRNELDEETLARYGLADRMERVRRLCEAAEAVEKFAGEDAKWSGEYRRYLAQIQSELEPLGITFHLTDSWAQLLTKLVEAGRVDEGEVGTEGTPD